MAHLCLINFSSSRPSYFLMRAAECTLRFSNVQTINKYHLISNNIIPKVFNFIVQARIRK